MQGIPEMHDIPKMKDVSAFTKVMDLIIGSLLMIFGSSIRGEFDDEVFQRFTHFV